MTEVYSYSIRKGRDPGLNGVEEWPEINEEE
jgi:hypothetical protein